MLSNGNINFEHLADGRTQFVGVGVCPNKVPFLPPTSSGARTSAPPHDLQVALSKCVSSFHLHQILLYQPATRYWPFQWAEFGCFVVLALALATFSYWWVRRRLA